MKKLIEFLSGTQGEPSSKRLFMFVLIILYVVVVISNLYWKYELKQTLEDGLFWLIIGFYFGITAERLPSIGNLFKK